MSSIDDEISQGQLKAIEDAVLMSASGSWTIENPGHGDLPVSARSHCILQKDDLVLISSGTGASMLLVIEPKLAPMSLADAIDGKYSDDHLVVLRKFWLIEDKQTIDECLSCAWCLFNARPSSSGVRDIDSFLLASVVTKLRSEERQYPFRAQEARFRTDPLAQGLISIPQLFESGDWHLTPDWKAMASTIPGSRVIEKVVYSPSGILEQGYENWEEEERRRVDAMLASIRSAKLTPSDAVVMLYVIDKLIRSGEPSIYVSLHELLDLEGIGNRRTRAFNQEQADRYHRIFTLIHQTRFFYRGEPRWVGKGENRRKQVDAYESPAFVYGGRKATMQSRLPGLGAADNWEIHRFKYHLLPSQYIQSMQRDSSLSSWLGDLKAIARIPSGKARGNWAKAIATYLIPHARRNAKHDRNKIPIKRKTLFESVVMDPTPEKVLESDKPARAIQYFTEAMEELKSIGIISDWSDPTPAKGPPRGWRDDWLDQTIEITMGKAYKEQLALIADKCLPSQKRLPKPPKK